MMKRNEGFTLVELMVSIAISTLVITAATSTLLLGLRINAQTTKNIEQQNTTDLLMQVLQNVAEEENISVTPDEKSIKIEDTSIVSYADNTIYLRDVIYMENVDEFKAELTKNNQLLTIQIKIGEHTYKASAYCRLNPTPTPIPTPDQGGTPNES